VVDWLCAATIRLADAGQRAARSVRVVRFAIARGRIVASDLIADPEKLRRPSLGRERG
jgi:hypothetical protein